MVFCFKLKIHGVQTMPDAIKEFEVEEGSTRNSWYRIVVKFRGKKVDEFLRPTMSEARRDYHSAGYKPVAWAEGSRIVLRDRY